MQTTTYQKLPYPLPADPGALALHLQQLADAVDAKLDDLDAQWLAQMNKPTAVIRRNTNLTGISANTDTQVLMETIDKEVGGNLTSGQTITPDVGLEGWYHLKAQVSFNAGTPTANTQRRAMIKVVNFSLLSASFVVEEFWVEEYENNGSVNVTVEGVAYLDSTRTAQVWVRHTNATAIDVTAPVTWLAATRICPKV
jgi:hypothetical protein